MRLSISVVSTVLAVTVLTTGFASAQAPKSRAAALSAPAAATHPNGKRGGVVLAMHREDLAQGFSIHETATISTVWAVMVPHHNIYNYGRMQEVWLDR